MKKFSNSLLFLTTGAIVALFVLVGFVFWQRERTMLQIQPLSPSPTQAHPEPTPRPTPAPTVQPSADPTASWKTYRNEKYGFGFRYPDSWIDKEDICPAIYVGLAREFCLTLLDYKSLPLEKNAKLSEGISAEISTRERFTQYKQNIDHGMLPPGYINDPTGGWKFVKIAGQNAIQILYYDFMTGSYVMETDLFTNDVGIFIEIFLPLGPYYYDNSDSEKRDAESKKMIEKINKGLVDDTVKAAIAQYQMLLSSFKFTK